MRVLVPFVLERLPWGKYGGGSSGSERMCICKLDVFTVRVGLLLGDGKSSVSSRQYAQYCPKSHSYAKCVADASNASSSSKERERAAEQSAKNSYRRRGIRVKSPHLIEGRVLRCVHGSQLIARAQMPSQVRATDWYAGTDMWDLTRRRDKTRGTAQECDTRRRHPDTPHLCGHGHIMWTVRPIPRRKIYCSCTRTVTLTCLSVENSGRREMLEADTREHKTRVGVHV